MKLRPFPLLAGGIALLLTLAILALLLNLGTFAAARLGENRTAEALLRVETLYSAVKDAERGQRGYLLTGDEAYLEPYRRAVREIEGDLAAVQDIASGSARQHHFQVLGALTHAKLGELARSIALRRTAGAEAARAVMLDGEGQRLMAGLRDEISALQGFIRAERGREQDRQWWRAAGSAGLIFGTGAAATLLFGGLALFLSRRVQRRERSIEALLQEQLSAEFERISSSVLLGALPVGVLVADASGRIVRSNAEASRIWGGAAAVAAIGRGQQPEAWWLDSGKPLAPEDWAIARALRTGETSVSETVRLRSAEGRESVIVTSAAPMRDAGGRLLGAVAVVQDVSQRQREQDRRLEAEAQYRAIVETAADAIVTIDATGVVHSANPAVTRIFGYLAAEVIGRNLALLMPERIGAVHDNAVARYFSTGQQYVAWSGREVTARHKDGGEFPVELSLARWRAGDGGERITGLMRDVSEQRRAERALQESDRRLRELQVEFLHIARLSEMGLMAATLAHELNQPLAAAANYIGGARRMLEAEGAQVMARLPALQDALTVAAQQAIHAGQITRRMRDFVARRETDRCPESLVALARAAAELAMLPAREKDIQLRLCLDLATPRVLADRVQIRQVLVSLMYNAIDAMEGCARRVLTVRTGPEGEGMAGVVVADTGSGIPPEIAHDLFLPFVTTKRSGLGVGLSVCRTIVEAHGGRIWAEANPGGGTVFHLTLPALQAGAGSR